ncbi:MFS transporter [Chitiniphilus purpureus]|uniref:MFS transporter n=1 Tax=Chitiniphilus purpureus TaxID=2981137 RepID=A0ABY6DNY9_9NEIS|nr:MFS transporter [Chitiniphilus sp. CD1]UXY16057.1 MFS transporter [Chitiniphilus sp. CD1]
MHAFLERHRFLLAFVLLSSLAGLSVGVAKVATSLYALHLAASDFELSLIAGAQSIGILVMGMPIGVLVDQLGPLRLFAFGSVSAGLLYLVTPWLPVPLLLALTAVLVSFCMPCRFVSLNAVFMQQLDKVGVAKAGWFRGTHMIGFFLLGPALAASLIGAVDYVGTYTLVGLLFFATAALAPQVMRHYTPAAGAVLSVAAVLDQFTLLRRDRELAGISLIEFASQAANQYYGFFIVVIALRQFGFSAGAAASLVTLQGSLFVFALFTLGALLQRTGEYRFYQASFALIAAALAMLGLGHTAVWLWLGAAVLGLGLGMLQTVNISRFARASARLGRGRVAGINAFAGPAGGLAGCVLGGWSGQVFGLQSAFVLLSPVFLLFGCRMWRQARRAPAPAVSLPDLQGVHDE